MIHKAQPNKHTSSMKPKQRGGFDKSPDVCRDAEFVCTYPLESSCSSCLITRYVRCVHACIWLINQNWVIFFHFLFFHIVLAGKKVSRGISRVIEQILSYFCWMHSECINNIYILTSHFSQHQNFLTLEVNINLSLDSINIYHLVQYFLMISSS